MLPYGDLIAETLMKHLPVAYSRRHVIYACDLLRALVRRDMKLRYKRSILGVAWTLLNPLTQLLVFVFVFTFVLPLNIPHYPSFLFTGILVWNWFQGALHQSTGAIVDNRELLRRPGFPVAMLPMVTVTSYLVHFLLALPVLLLFLMLDGHPLTSVLLALPGVMGLQFLLILSLAYLVATLHVTFRDTQYLLGVLLNLLFYLTPVFYNANSIPERYQALYRLNPMTHLVEAYREILLQGVFPEHLAALLVLGVCVVGLLACNYTLLCEPVRISLRSCRWMTRLLSNI
jgi:lipopolysaccharide transport system permease protein